MTDCRFPPVPPRTLPKLTGWLLALLWTVSATASWAQSNRVPHEQNRRPILIHVKPSDNPLSDRATVRNHQSNASDQAQGRLAGAPASPMNAPPIDSFGQRLIQDPRQVDLGIRPIGEIQVDIAPKPDRAGRLVLPADRAQAYFAQLPTIRYYSSPAPAGFEYWDWVMANQSCHRPLYFEDGPLERHGHTCGWFQPAVSAAHFFSAVPLLPYKMVSEHPHVCVYDQHPYLAGRDVPCYYLPRDPVHWPAALAEAGLAVGLIFLIP